MVGINLPFCHNDKIDRRAHFTDVNGVSQIVQVAITT